MFLTVGMVDMVILDAMDDLGVPQGSYPESFSLISLCSLKLYMIFGVNCQPETRERDKTRDERRVKLTLTLPGNVRQG